jgi:deazaflavin-dependent oxidoreductase (nitroreductase family)
MRVRAARSGYRGGVHRPFDQSNPPQRLLRWLAGTDAGSWLFARLLPPLDEAFSRLTGGRRTLTAVLSGLPTVMLTTSGARSGRPRTVPLLGFATDHGVAVIASNWGRAQHPAWSHNLRVHPEATAAVFGRELAVRAVAAEADRRTRIWNQALAFYPSFAIYERRAAHREIVVWVLEPVTA